MSPILNIKENTYALLLFTAIALLLTLVFPPIFNIDFKDKTMFSIPLTIMVWLIPLFLISFWMLYLLTKRFLYSMAITRIHIAITVSVAILVVIIMYIGLNPSQLTIDRQELIGNTMKILSVLFVFAQLIYLANVLLGLITKYK